MANKKFSEFVLKTSTSDVSHIVGYNGAENVQITPANFVTGGGTGVFLPLAGGLMVGNTTHNDNVKSIYGSPGNDLEIFHNGADSFIKDSGTGSLKAVASGFQLLNANETQFMILADGGAGNTYVKLYFNGGEKVSNYKHRYISNRTRNFTGNVGIGGAADNLLTLQGTSGDTHQRFKEGSTTIGFIGGATGIIGSQDGKLAIRAEAGLVLSSQGNNVDVVIDGGNATFAGNVALENASSPTLTIKDTTNNVTALYGSQNTNAFLGTFSNHYLSFFTNSTEKMRLDASGNLIVGGTAVGSTNSFSIQSNGILDQRWAAGTAKSQVLNVIPGFSNGFQTSQDTSNNLTYIFHRGTDNLQLLNLNSSSAGFLVNVGVGTSTPEAKMHIQDGSAGTVTASSESSLVVEGSSNTAINLLSPDNKQSSLYFGSPSDAIGCQIAWKHDVKDLVVGTAVTSGGEIAFKTGNNVEKMRIAAAGEIQFGTGSNNGGFIDFNGTSVQINTQRNPNTGAFVNTAKSNASINLVGADGGSYIRFSTANANNTTASEKLRLDSSGNLLVGTTSTLGGATDDFVTVANADGGRGGIRIGNTGGSGNTSCMRFNNSNGVVGGIRTSGSATSYDTSSDYRLKEDLQDFKGLDLVSKIPVYNYKWKADESRSYGVMAHELEEVLPQAVSGEKDAEEMQSVDYSKIVPLLVKSIQELSAKLEALECQCEKK